MIRANALIDTNLVTWQSMCSDFTPFIQIYPLQTSLQSHCLTKIEKQPLKNFFKSDVSTLHIRMYSDSSIANNEDQSTRIGFLNLLAPHYKRCNIIQYASNRIREVVGSVLVGEAFAFVDVLDFSHTLQHNLEALLSTQTSIRLFP